MPQFFKHETFPDIRRKFKTVSPDISDAAIFDVGFSLLEQELASSDCDDPSDTIGQMQGLYADLMLLTDGRPYYKVFPDFVEPLIDTRLDIPSEHFRLPFRSWEIRLPEAVFKIDDEFWIKSILVYDLRKVWSGCGLHTVYDSTMQVGASIEELCSEHADIPTIHQGELIRAEVRYFHPDLPEMDHTGFMCEELYLDLRHTVGASLEKTRATKTHEAAQSCRLPKIVDTEHALNRCWRLVMTLSFLITGRDKIIEPDLLNKDLDKLKKPLSAEEIQRLHDKSSRLRRDGKGYSVGRRERLLQLAMERRSEMEDEAKTSGRALQHSHIRCGHLHGYHTKLGYVVKWLPALTVRPDLSPNPAGRAGVKVTAASKEDPASE